MGRTKSNLNDLKARVAHLEKENIDRKREIKAAEEQIALLTDTQITRMLQETNSPYSDKFRYSYEEISKASGRSTGYISNLARENGLSRRSLKSV